ncbi:Response regulator UvrY [Chryseobacterium aquaeductus]|uniref:Response regulator UvrY n=1 Tax=Chryseobacterium aquaeductus TaxID=2675056 RepID=A0A9N8MEY8_9FLAO|nr:response regulator transcription factor [Chryseobacterium aquaeductus]CAA7330003.1 Response regulator UvrY [Chryseobacterium potabilaquae]CAD7800593.1 Response regulator UvrY [Chryseobacterium aquaeductus]
MNLSDQKSLTFLLADDHSLIRQGIIFLLEDLEINVKILQAANLQQTIEAVKTNSIDVAIIDAHFPDGNSITFLPELNEINPETKILIFTGIDEGANALKYINAGADGFLSKMSEEEEIKNAILQMIKEGEYISSVTQGLLLNSLKNGKPLHALSLLTGREMQIAKMYAEGFGNLEIANKLNIKQNTVSTIKKRLFHKLEIENIVELIELFKQ